MIWKCCKFTILVQWFWLLYSHCFLIENVNLPVFSFILYHFYIIKCDAIPCNSYVIIKSNGIIFFKYIHFKNIHQKFSKQSINQRNIFVLIIFDHIYWSIFDYSVPEMSRIWRRKRKKKKNQMKIKRSSIICI